MPNVLEIESLSHLYGQTPVLNQVSMQIQEGELVSILGRSGAGKTTLLRAVGGFITPSSGRITIGGRDVYREGRALVSAEKRGLGIVFQDYALFSHMTVTDNIGFGLPKRERRGPQVESLLRAVDLYQHANNSGQGSPGVQTEQADGHRNCQLKKVGRADHGPGCRNRSWLPC